MKRKKKSVATANFELEQFVRVLSGWTDYAIEKQIVTMLEVRDCARKLINNIEADSRKV